ncbi:peroxisomal biogenesis factor 11 [Kockiozyma suomiensis]|uniref:peroxisomal biogenesis factor 11 n=1 Tax=Kockiozyma suomiensis TaxID=1337062 RepID=UPI00334311CD
MVADALVYHPSLAHLLRFFDSTVGRDKLMRIVQYFARFYAAFLLRSADSTKIKEADKWRALMSLFSTARKILRIGKPLQHLKAAATAYDNKTADAFLRYTAVGRQLSYGAYLTCDSALLAHSTKLLTLRNPQLIQKLYYRLWLAGITFSVASGIYKHVGLSQRESSLARASEKDIVAVKKVRAEKKKASTQFALDVLDSTIPISGLSLVPIDDGVVGLAGMLSSAIGSAEQWKATA